MPDAVHVTLPEMGESVTEGTVVEWRKQEGEPVAAGEVIADITTDKVDVEVSAPADGVLEHITVPAGESARVGSVIAEIAPQPARSNGGERAGADPSTTAPPPGTPRSAEADADTAVPLSAPDAARAAGDDVRRRPVGPSTDSETVVIELPEMGESVTEGAVARWLVEVGDPVTAGDPVVEVTTDKVDVEVPAPATGRLVWVDAAEGATVTVGASLGRIAADAQAPTATAAAESSPDPSQPAAAASPPGAREALHRPAPAAPAISTAALAQHPASPLARRAAALRGVDLRSVTGSGPGGLIRRADVHAAARAPSNGAAAAAPPAPAAPPPPPPEAARRPGPSSTGGPVPPGSTLLRGPVAALAGHMEQSREIPTATSFRTLEVGALEQRRREINEALKASGRNQKVSFTHLIGYAIVRAALRYPAMATSFQRDEAGRPYRVSPGVHLGLAVDTTRKDGSRFLVVPVIKGAATMSFADFREEYERLVGKARAGTLTTGELRGATIVLTNPGGIGTVASVPRLMQGQGTIVATGSIDFPPGFRGFDAAQLAELGVSKAMTVTSTYDHRVIQGAESGEFLRHIDQLLGGADDFYAEVLHSLRLTEADTRGLSGPSAILAPAAPAVDGAPSHEMLAAVAAGMSLVRAHRTHGHLAAHLDPLGLTPPPGDPAMDPETVNLTEPLMEQIPADVLRVYVPGSTLAEVLPRLRETYCGTIAYEIEHLSSHEQRVWLREHIELGRHRAPLTPDQRLQLLHRLTKVDAMERYLRRAFIGQKTFSIEGLDSMVPMLEELVNMVSADGIGQVVMGMSHRGRLAVTTHVVNRPYSAILVAFEEGERRRRLGEDAADPTGDVKYHLGATGTYITDDARAITMRLLDNPSHLEFVDPVVEGWTRSEQTRRSAATLHVDPTAALPVLIHGDAAFPGQGIVAEVLNLQALDGYTTGGTVHVIANNQVGFTTNPADGRSTRYASDLAKGFDIPIVHVNADDVEACIHAMRLAYDYRRTYHRDVVLDLVGYRRFGHNETDEPSYTQPLMYTAIKSHPPVRELFANKLIEDGLLTREQVEDEAQQAYDRVARAHQRVKATMATGPAEGAEEDDQTAEQATRDVRTGVSLKTLGGLCEQLLAVPDSFTLNLKLVKQMERRRDATRRTGEVDWANAEALAFASLLQQGRAIRLTGQDTARGTFSQRHLTFYDVENGRAWTPLQHVVGATATFELHDSPLAEAGTMGFEYGYSIAAPDALVLWEAQFGDFVNAAQVIVDQFVASGFAKWGQRSRLVLLLPHGYEGAGPEHSSARVERFLQLSANGNIRVANCSTAAQYFHLLRQQALTPKPRPLVVMTPKSMLRNPSAGATLDQLSAGGFQRVIDDRQMSKRREEVTTLLLCSGKIYHELEASPKRAQATRTAIARVELLDPLPLDDIIEIVTSYPKLEQLFWVQEEPKNMGAWYHLSRAIGRHRPYHVRWDYIGRPRRASPSEGYHGAHVIEQERLVTEALSIEQTGREEALAAARSGASS